MQTSPPHKADRATTTELGWCGVAALGLATITAYGSWFYGFGVLIGPISEDTGWSTTALGNTYGAAQLITGLGAFIGGRLLDRFGSKGPFSLQAVVGGGMMMASTWATDVWTFAILYAVGAGVTGATGFYHVTTAAASRLRADRPDRAIALLTLIGALCSPIYLPLAAWMVDTTHWRTTARILALATIIGAILAALVAKGGRSPSTAGPTARPLLVIRNALAVPAIRRMLLVYATAAAAYTSILVYQVPVLNAGGLTLTTAGAVAGLRGFCQIFGRIGLTGLADRFGAGQLLRLSYILSALGVAFMFIATVPTGIAYAVLAGTALGTITPLQAIYARNHFNPTDLGLLMGLQGAAIGIGSAIGPSIGGGLRDLTSTWTPTLLMSVAGLIVATIAIRPPDTTTNN